MSGCVSLAAVSLFDILFYDGFISMFMLVTGEGYLDQLCNILTQLSWLNPIFYPVAPGNSAAPAGFDIVVNGNDPEY